MAGELRYLFICRHFLRETRFYLLYREEFLHNIYWQIHIGKDNLEFIIDTIFTSKLFDFFKYLNTVIIISPCNFQPGLQVGSGHLSGSDWWYLQLERVLEQTISKNSSRVLHWGGRTELIIKIFIKDLIISLLDGGTILIVVYTQKLFKRDQYVLAYY